MKSGRDQMVIDPDPDKIYTKRKRRIMNVMSCAFSSSPSVKYPSDGWGKSLERMPSFTRIDSQVSLLREEIPDLEKIFGALEWRLCCFENISKNDSLITFFSGFPNLKTVRALDGFNVLPNDINVRQQTIFCLENEPGHIYTVFN